jgi:hypothetical protein
VLGLDGRGNTGRFADYAQWEDWLEEQDAFYRSPQLSLLRSASKNLPSLIRTSFTV